jgi:hypothetical protein
MSFGDMSTEEQAISVVGPIIVFTVFLRLVNAGHRIPAAAVLVVGFGAVMAGKIYLWETYTLANDSSSEDTDGN